MTGEPMRFPARAVERLADGAGETADAIAAARSEVRGTAIGPGTYGMLCRFLPGVLGPVLGLGADALESAAGSVRQTAEGLRATARSMRGTDEANGRRIVAAARANELSR